MNCGLVSLAMFSAERAASGAPQTPTAGSRSKRPRPAARLVGWLAMTGWPEGWFGLNFSATAATLISACC
jgi:hypothetical protein